MRRLLNCLTGERGQVLPIVLVALAVGGVLLVPSLNYVSDHLNAGEVLEENVKALYAADAGFEDAIWKLKYEPWPHFPYTYTLPAAVNGMTVAVTMDYIEELGGEDTPRIGVHEDWLDIVKTATYDQTAGHYDYLMSITDWYTPSQIKIERIVLDLPARLVYRYGTTGGDITSADPDPINGDNVPDNTTGIMLTWEVKPWFVMQQPKNGIPMTAILTFELDGPPGLLGVTGLTAITVTRQDIGTITDYWPFTITSTARDPSGVAQATITGGIWQTDNTYIRSWELSP